MVRIGLPRRPGPMSSTSTLYPAPNLGPPSNHTSGTSSSADPNQLYGVQLYGHDAAHIRFAATRYATEARKLLQSLLPSTPHTSTRSGANNVARIEETTNRALVYAAESRRLLATATTLESSNDVLSKSFLPPTPRYKFSCALNLITTDLSAEDTAVADKFVHYATQAHELDGKGVSYAGDNRVEMCEYECKRIIDAQVPNLVDHHANQKDLEREGRSRKVGQGGGNPRYNTSRRLVLVLGALAAIAGLSGYTIHRHRSSSASSHAGGGQVSSATDSDWNDNASAFVDGTSTPTASAAVKTDMPTAEPTVYSGNDAAAPGAAPVAAAYDDNADDQQQENIGESEKVETGTSGNTFVDDLLSNPWALGTIAGVLSFVVLGLVALVLRRNPSKSEPLIDADEVGHDDDKDGGGNNKQISKPAAVAVAVGHFHTDDPEYQTKVVMEDVAPQAAAVAAAAPSQIQQVLQVERSQSALSARDQIRHIPVQRSSSTMSAKDKVQQMIQAEQMSRRPSAGGGVTFRSGDDSLVSDTGVPTVPRYSQKKTRGYAPPPIPAVQNGTEVGRGGDKRDQHDRSLPPLQLQ